MTKESQKSVRDEDVEICAYLKEKLAIAGISSIDIQRTRYRSRRSFRDL